MEKVILKSMTDFVLEQRMSTEKVNESSFYQIQSHIYSYYDKMFACANFLKQPLNLGMFMPCDLEGNVLEEPKGIKCCGGIQYDCDCRGELQYDDELLKEYQEAKDRVLFEGFEIKCHYLVKGGVWLFLLKEIKNYIIEDILKDFEDVELTLTPTAQKQIGL